MQDDLHFIAEAPAFESRNAGMDHGRPVRAIAPARFTIGRIMVVIAVVAGLLALPLQFSLIVIALAIPCAAVGIARRLAYRRQLRLAAYAFWARRFRLTS